MLVHTFTLAMHLLYRSVQTFGPLARTFEYFLPGVQSCLSARVMSVKASTVNSKHLQKGDPLPPYRGVLRVYNMRYCPYAQRTILVLNAKDIDYEVVNVNLADKPDWLVTKSPFTKVPSIEISEGVVVCESLITAEYLDDAYPQRRLQAADPLTRAKDKIIIEFSSALHTLFFKWVKFPETIDEDLKTRFYTALDYMQAELVARGTTFLGGNQPGYVDYMIWPWFERLELLKGEHGTFWPLPEKYSKLTEYIATLKKDPAISQYLIDEDILTQFSQGYREGKPRYDFLDGK